jgi:hypothetical protein
MVEIKEMPYSDRYHGILDLIDLLKSFAPKFVKENLGQAKADELQKRWEEESEPIPSEAPYQEKYDIAHRNFLQNWITALNFVKEHPEADPDKYMQVAIDAWTKRQSSNALALRLFRGISSKEAAFESLANRLAYNLQVFSPFTASELTKSRMVLAVTPCKIRKTRGRDDFCLAACQNIIPISMANQYKVSMKHKRDGDNCTVTFEPL